MLKTRIAIIVTLVVGFVAFHLVEQAWHGGRTPSFLEEVLFIGGLVFGVSLLVAGILRLRLIQRVNQVSSRARAILKADNWTARVAKDGAGQDLSELSDAVNGLLEVADASQRELRERAPAGSAEPGADRAHVAANWRIGHGRRSAATDSRDLCADARSRARQHVALRREWRRAALRRPVSERHGPALVWRAAVRARCSCLFQRHRSRPCRRGDRCACRSADARVQRVLSDNAWNRRHARRAAPPGGPPAGRDVHRACRRAACVEVRRAELCAVPRQSRCRGSCRLRSPAGSAESGQSEARARLVLDSAHDALSEWTPTAGSFAGTRRRRRRSAGRATRSSASSCRTRSFLPASARRTRRLAPLPRNGRGADRQPPAGTARPPSRRARVSDRNYGDQPGARRTRILLRRLRAGYLRAPASEDELRMAKETAEAATRAKSEFLAT